MLFLPVAIGAVLTSALAAPLAAKDSLGVFSDWGAFRDAETPRCYAIAMAQPGTRTRAYQPFASIGTWPQRQVRNQIHIRLSQKLGANSRITLRIGGQSFALTGGGGDAWAADKTMDAAVVAAMRSAGSMTISARDTAGKNFTDSYSLAGASTAIDAATVGCARR